MTVAHKIQVAVLMVADITLLSFLIWDITDWHRKERSARVTSSDASTEQ